MLCLISCNLKSIFLKYAYNSLYIYIIYVCIHIYTYIHVQSMYVHPRRGLFGSLCETLLQISNVCHKKNKGMIFGGGGDSLVDIHSNIENTCIVHEIEF